MSRSDNYGESKRFASAARLHYHKNMNKESVLAGLKEKGYRLTNIRKKIIEMLAGTNVPLSIQDFIEKLERQGLTANKTTIYREIGFLMKNEIVTEIDFGDRRKRYESAHVEHHHHLVCLKCSRVQDITLNNDLKKEEQRLSKQNNFKIIKHSLEFFGFCEKCK